MEVDEMEEPEDSGRKLLSKKTLAALIAIILVLAVALPAVVFFVFFIEPEESYMTMSRLVDNMSDTDGDGFPDDYDSYDVGDNVTVRDRIQNIREGFGGYLDLEFPYTGTKWEIYAHIGYVSAMVNTSSTLCSYGEGDWITLEGTVDEYVWNGNRTELILWTLVDEEGPSGLPSIELALTHRSNDTWRIEMSNCSFDCRLWHFEFVLKRYGLGWDWLQGPEHGKRSILMEFWDVDRDGCLSDGDVLYVMPKEAGDYEVMLQFQSEELTSVSFQYDGP